MKATLKTVALLSLLSGLSQAAVTISGTVGTSFKGSDGLTNIPVGSLFLVIADAGVAGFLESGSGDAVGASLNGLTSASDPGVTPGQASILAGGFFGGDKILATGAVTSAGVLPTMLSSVSIAGFESAKFALIWFEKSSTTLTNEGLGGQKYGIISGADWTLPASDAGTFTMSTTDATPATNYFSFGTTVTAAQLGSAGFFTGSGVAGDATADVKGATFTLIPEPSAALLGAIGAIGLLRRRRI